MPLLPLSPDAITDLVQIQAGLGIAGLSLSLISLGHRHIIEKRPIRFHAHMTIILFVLDFLDAFPMILSRTTYDPPSGSIASSLSSSSSTLKHRTTYDKPFLCDIQGMAITTFEVCIILWNSFMALQTYRWIILKQDTLVLRKQLYPTLVGILSYAILNSTLWRVFYTKNGPADLWCWFPLKKAWARLGAVYIYVYPAMLFIGWVFVQIYRKVGLVKKKTSTSMQTAARLRVGVRLILYLVCFMATWFFPMVNRTMQMATGHKPRPILLLLHVLSKPSMGIWDSLVYGSFWVQAFFSNSPWGARYRRGGGGPSRKVASLQTVSSGLQDRHRPSRFVTQDDPITLRERGYDDSNSDSIASIFVTTYNCGGLTAAELDLVEMMPYWIPRHHPVYIIGVQELKGLKPLQKLCHQYLGGPSMYTAFIQEISVIGVGSVAVMIFALTAHVENNLFEMTAVSDGGQQVCQGANLLICRAGNKGAVCLPFRYHHANLCILAVHLPADGRHGSGCEKRMKALRKIFRDAAAVADESFDINLQYHHTILLGDLNFRLNGDPEQVLFEVAEAARAARDDADCFNSYRSRTSSAASTIEGGREGGGVGGDGGSSNTLGNRSPRMRRLSEESDSSISGSYLSLKRNWIDTRYQALEYEGNSIPPSREWEALIMIRDELRAAQKQGQILYNFREHAIGFPPSYRRVRGLKGDTRDYTDARLLQWCYTTNLRKGRSRPSLLGFSKESSLLDSPGRGSESEGDGESVKDQIIKEEEEAPSSPGPSPHFLSSSLVAGDEKGITMMIGPGKAGGGGRKPATASNRIRVPSYTDRIWIHSLPSMEKALKIHSYELCDALWQSDHRPVSAVLHLDFRSSFATNQAYCEAYAKNARHHNTQYERMQQVNPSSPTSSSAGSYSFSSLPLHFPPSTVEHKEGKKNQFVPTVDRKCAAGAFPAFPPQLSTTSLSYPAPILIFHVKLCNMAIDLIPPPTISSNMETYASPPRPAATGARTGFASSPSFTPSPSMSPALTRFFDVPWARPQSPPRLSSPPQSPTLPSPSFVPSAIPQGAASSPAPAAAVRKVTVLFPLQPENLLEAHLRALQYLDTTLCHELPTWSSDEKSLLQNINYFDWQAEKDEGKEMMVSAAVRVGGSLHLLIKLMDGNGEDLGQAVLALPTPSSPSRSRRERKRQTVTSSITRQTVYRGSLSCNVEIHKVQVLHESKLQALSHVVISSSSDSCLSPQSSSIEMRVPPAAIE